MKILIVTAWYYPFIHPRAHRWTAIAEQWAREGHEGQVLTARVREQGFTTTRHGVQVHRVGFDSLKEWVYYQMGTKQARGRVGVAPGMPSIMGRLFAWLYKRIWKNLYFPDDACIWHRPARRKLHALLQTQTFDALITVSLPFTGHLLALKLHPEKGANSKQRRNTPKRHFPLWIADIGDPFALQAASPNNAFLYRRKNLRLEREVLETADAVSVTTAAMLHKYREQFGEKAVAHMVVIPPVLKGGLPEESRSNDAAYPLKLGYFGALYAPTRTPDAFLDLLEQTFAARPDLRDRLEVHFYGEVFPEFYAKLNAQPAIRLHGLRSREEVRQTMQEMDILVNIGNTTDFQLPSKAVEYLVAGKPVLHLSYVEQDPFTQLFEAWERLGKGLIFQWNVFERRVDSKALQDWLSWLEMEKPRISEAEIKAIYSAFSVEKIGKQYLNLIREAVVYSSRI